MNKRLHFVVVIINGDEDDVTGWARMYGPYQRAKATAVAAALDAKLNVDRQRVNVVVMEPEDEKTPTDILRWW